MIKKRIAQLLVLLAAVALVAGCSSSSKVPTEAPVSKAEQAKLLAEEQKNALDQLRTHFPDATPSPTSVQRFVAKRDWASALSGCMQKAGFATTIAPGGGGVAINNLPKQQQEAYDLAFYYCQTEYPVNPVDTAPLSSDEAKFLYSYLTTTLANCLEKHGQSIPNPPSEQTFADSYSTTGGWTPYSYVSDVSESRWAELNKECPQQPAGFRGN